RERGPQPSTKGRLAADLLSANATSMGPISGTPSVSVASRTFTVSDPRSTSAMRTSSDLTGRPGHVKSMVAGMSAPTVRYAVTGSRGPVRPVERPLQLLVLVLLVLLAYVLHPVMTAMVVGGFIVLVAQQPFEWLVRRLHGRVKLATWIATSSVALL